MQKNRAPAMKTERLNMLFSPAEVDAIDDWRFASRINGRSEAVRRLCQIGLALDQSAEKLEDQAALYLDHAAKAFQGRKGLINNAPPEVADWIEKSFLLAAAMAATAIETTTVIDELKGGSTVEEAMAEADKRREEAGQRVAMLQEPED